jgi:hypothetical protein
MNAELPPLRMNQPSAAARRGRTARHWLPRTYLCPW